MNWRRFIRSHRRHVLTMKATRSLNRALLFRRDAGRYASPAHLYCAFGMALLRGCYHQILGPRRHLPKFANGHCGHSDVWVRLHPHLTWQATKSYVERGNAFGFTSHKGSLTICSGFSGSPSARHARAGPARRVMNSRSLTRSPRRRGRATMVECRRRAPSPP
jgi:hypothetical protein